MTSIHLFFIVFEVMFGNNGIKMQIEFTAIKTEK